MDGNNKNTILAIALSIMIIIAWQFLYVNPKLEAERQAAENIASQQQTAPRGTTGSGSQISNSNIPTQDNVDGSVPSAQQSEISAAGNQSRVAAIANSKRVEFETDRLIGSINLTGARIDDLSLKDYRETIKKDSPLIVLLSPSEVGDAFFAEFGWVGSENTGNVPGPSTQWKLERGRRLETGRPITLSWTNEKGLKFSRKISVDENYLFTIRDELSNGTDKAVSLSPYGRITRFGNPDITGIYVLHEGLIGVFGEDGLQEYTYSEIEDDKKVSFQKATNGWLGITDKYWAAAIIPAGEFKPRFAYFTDGRASYQTDFLSDPITVQPGGIASVEQRLFAGAKEVGVVDAYNADLKLDKFDKIIDWGYFHFFTKPLFSIMDWLYKFLGNFGLAILATTVAVKAVFFPLANMSYSSMAKMKKLQPEMLLIRERNAEDKVKQQQEMMALYKKEKINPAAGCWPVLIQIPVFFALYKVIYITIEMRHAPFFGWIQDLAAPDPTSIFNLFGLLPYDVPTFLLVGVWPLLMGITMFLQMRMNPTPPDPTQAMIFTWMPIVFTFMLASFPAGLVIYWAWNNFLSILQQGAIMKRQGVKIELWDNLKSLLSRKPTNTPTK